MVLCTQEEYITDEWIRWSRGHVSITFDNKMDLKEPRFLVIRRPDFPDVLIYVEEIKTREINPSLTLELALSSTVILPTG